MNDATTRRGPQARRCNLDMRRGRGHSVRPRLCRDAIGCEKMVNRQSPRVRRPPVQAYCGDDTASHAGVAFGRRPSIKNPALGRQHRDGLPFQTAFYGQVKPNTGGRPCVRLTMREGHVEQPQLVLGNPDLRLPAIRGMISLEYKQPLPRWTVGRSSRRSACIGATESSELQCLAKFLVLNPK